MKVLKHSNMDKINREIMTLNAIKDKSPLLANLIDFGQEEMDGGIILVNNLIIFLKLYFFLNLNNFTLFS